MATYTKRGSSYRIRASVGYTPEGKQVMKSKTWTPAPGMTERQIEKELNRQMVLFDEECRGSSLTDGHIKFETFARQWMSEYVEKSLASARRPAMPICRSGSMQPLGTSIWTKSRRVRSRSSSTV